MIKERETTENPTDEREREREERGKRTASPRTPRQSLKMMMLITHFVLVLFIF